MKKIIMYLSIAIGICASQVSETAYIDYWGYYPGEIYNFTFCNHTCELLDLPQDHFKMMGDSYNFYTEDVNHLFALEPWNHSVFWGEISIAARDEATASLHSISSRGRGLGKTNNTLYLYNPKAIKAYSHGADVINSNAEFYKVVTIAADGLGAN